MNSTDINDNAPADSSSQALLELELRIARRADELAKTATAFLDGNFEFWLRAEREVLAK